MLLGTTLLQRVVDRIAGVVGEIVVVSAPGQALPPVAAAISVRIAEDDFPGCGPLGGIATGLARIEAPRALAVACDMPLLSAALIADLFRRSDDCDVVMPVIKYPEPLHAVYSPACIDPMRERLGAGQYKITGFLGAVRVCYVQEHECRALDPELRSFLNTNTDADLARVRRLLESA